MIMANWLETPHSDGHLVVHYPHMLVHPEYQGQRGRQDDYCRIKEKCEDFHVQTLVADRRREQRYKDMAWTDKG